MRDVRAFSEDYASQKGVEIRLEIEDSLPQLMADEKLIEELFVNLISNAIKYTPEGDLFAFPSSRKATSMSTLRFRTAVSESLKRTALVFSRSFSGARMPRRSRKTERAWGSSSLKRSWTYQRQNPGGKRSGEGHSLHRPSSLHLTCEKAPLCQGKICVEQN